MRIPIHSFALICLLGLTPPAGHTDAFDEWQITRPLVTGDDLNGIAYGGNTFVAVGGHDGDQPSAVVVQSKDGIFWTISRIPGPPLTGIVFGDNRFVAVGGADFILTSEDGTKWQTNHLAACSQCELRSVTYGNGVFVAVGGKWSPANNIYSPLIETSSDGEHWLEGPYLLLEGVLSKVSFADGRFFTETLTSVDGVSWTTVSATNPIPNLFDESDAFELEDEIRGSSRPALSGKIARSEDKHVAVGNNGWIITSTNGRHWVQEESGTYRHLKDVAANSQTFVVVGNGGTILTSLGGTKWIQRAGSPATFLDDITYAKGKFVAIAVGNESWSNQAQLVLLSDDGADWKRLDLRTNRRFTAPLLFGNERFVACAYDQGTMNPWVSSDAESWTRHPFDFTVNYIGSGCFGLDRFVLLGFECAREQSGAFNCQNVIPLAVTSDDALHWSKQQLPASVEVIAFGNDLFLALGGGIKLVSKDAKHWTVGTTPLPPSAIVSSIAFGNGRFVAVSNSEGLILTTSDGSDWQVTDTGFKPLGDALVRFGGGAFLYVNDNQIMTSVDGINWIRRALPAESEQSTHPLIAAFGADRFVAAGAGYDYGRLLLRSGELTPRMNIFLPQLPTEKSISLGISGGVFGQRYVLEQSPDLVTWSPIATNAIPAQEQKFHTAFYRLQLAPYLYDNRPRPY